MRLGITLWILITLGAAGAAFAGPPDPATSTVPPFVRVVGMWSGIPDPTGQYKVVVRDFAGVLQPGVLVTLSFFNCSDTRLAMVQAENARLHCDNNAITVQTNAIGEAIFTVVGASNAYPCGAPMCPPGAGASCVRVCADGVALGAATAVVYDLDGVSPSAENGINALDLGLVRNEVSCAGLGGPYRGRADYNMDGAINAADLAAYFELVVRPAMTGKGSRDGTEGVSFCPGPFVPFPCP